MAENIASNDYNLRETFSKGFELKKEIEQSELPFNSSDYQVAKLLI